MTEFKAGDIIYWPGFGHNKHFRIEDVRDNGSLLIRSVLVASCAAIYSTQDQRNVEKVYGPMTHVCSLVRVLHNL